MYAEFTQQAILQIKVVRHLDADRAVALAQQAVADRSILTIHSRAPQFLLRGKLAMHALLPALFLWAQTVVAAPAGYIPSHISPELQSAIRDRSTTPIASSPSVEAYNEKLLKRFPVKLERLEMAGVPVHVIMPPEIRAANRNRVLMHLHGGSYNSGGGMTGITEPVLMAHYTGIKVISVDYRMPPEHPYPAALEDSVAVWKEILRTVKPQNAGIGGSSAGGGLTLATVLKLKALHLPEPAALFAGTPWADLTNQSDTTVLSLRRKPPAASGLHKPADMYAGDHDKRDPFLSPVNGDFTGFPPTLLISGTRDDLLSDTVRVHRKLRAAGIEADLHVFEASAHAAYMLLWNTPESAEAYGELAKFFERHLGSE